MSKQDTAKYLYLPLEIVIREHDGKAVLAHAAARAGWTVLMGPKIALYNICDQLPEGVFVIKSATPLELSQIKMLKNAGHNVCSLDEEGVVTFKEFLGNNVRYGEETVAEIDQFLFWGEEQAKSYRDSFPQHSSKGHITGNPRVDFWTQYAAESYKSRIQNIQKQYGKYILIPSSFGIGNNILGAGKGLELTQNHSGTLSKELNRFMIGQAEQNLIAFKEYIDFLPEILTKFSDTNFIIRPHPSEAHAPWEELAEKFDNLHLVYKGAVTPWILAARAIFHFKSTTSIEAHLMGVPAITYIPPLPPYMDKYELTLPIAVSRTARTRTDLLKLLDTALKEKNTKTPGEVEGVLKDWISFDPKTPPSAHIVRKLNDIIPPQSTRALTTPRASTRQKLDNFLENTITKLAKYPTLGPILPKRVKSYLKSKAYGKRKYMDTNIAHTKNIIRVMEEKHRGKDEALNVSSFTDQLFLVKKDGA
jgi:surface carbohydrate biosynthesis protein